MGSTWHPIVAVPARNEAQRLPRLIEALAGQSWIAARGRALRLVIVFNNCTDGSAGIARAAAARHPGLEMEAVEIAFPEASAHVGSARRLAMQRASEIAGGRAGSVLLSTDADAVPPPDWVEANLRAIDEGADLVGGRIVGDPDEEARLGPAFGRRAARHLRYLALADRLAALVDPLPHDPWPRHWDHTGASLAVRGEVHEAVGGVPAIPFREDLAFVTRARAMGFLLRHAPDVEVGVSARLAGRAQGGMADCLKAWIAEEEEGRPHLVEAPSSVLERLERRRMLRSLAGLRREQRDAVLARLGLDADVLAPDTQALVEAHAPDDPDAMAAVPVDLAIDELARMIAEREGEVRAA